jgi:hypothetical protein
MDGFEVDQKRCFGMASWGGNGKAFSPLCGVRLHFEKIPVHRGEWVLAMGFEKRGHKQFKVEIAQNIKGFEFGFR